MRIGVVYPQTEFPSDPGAIRAYATAVEELGYTHILAYDHVLGADPGSHPGWSGPYSTSDPFAEPLVLYGYLAGICSLELVTGVIVLPQRQTALVAKQAALVDRLTEGRFRLGVGVGWNQVEYQALGEDFADRGDRLEEQVEVMRALWTEPVVDYSGRFHRIDGAGLNPLPVQRPIPVWFGASVSRRAFRRIGRLGDGWMPQVQPGPQLSEALELVAQGAREAGRDPASIGMEGRISIPDAEFDDLTDLAERAEAWRRAGASHLSVNTMRAGLTGVDGHIELLTRLAPALTDS